MRLLSGIVLSGGAAVGVVRAWRICRGVQRRRARTHEHAHLARMVGRRIPDLDAVVIDSEERVAYCIAGRERSVVITRGALAVLDPRQLAAVLAHERAHLGGRLLAGARCRPQCGSGTARGFPVPGRRHRDRASVRDVRRRRVGPRTGKAGPPRRFARLGWASGPGRYPRRRRWAHRPRRAAGQPASAARSSRRHRPARGRHRHCPCGAVDVHLDGLRRWAAPEVPGAGVAEGDPTRAATLSSSKPDIIPFNRL
ncbi:M48 family metalloprotease [Rhodococcus sp. D-6]|uniref:M48 family metalloprotease n=1 Tax=Rhodococcus sp. D-6 TaxID=1387842 RepID=UPI0033067900